MTMFSSLRGAVAKRSAYNRTYREIRNMPLDVARDLDINPLDARRIAHSAIYG